MSSEEIVRFKNDVAGNTTMQDEIKSLGGDIDAIVSLANERGYSFTSDDVKADNSARDLSDDELDQVSGGAAIMVSGGGGAYFLST